MKGTPFKGTHIMSPKFGKFKNDESKQNQLTYVHKCGFPSPKLALLFRDRSHKIKIFLVERF